MPTQQVPSAGTAASVSTPPASIAVRGAPADTPEVSDAEVSDAEVSDAEVSDAEVSDAGTEVSDAGTEGDAGETAEVSSGLSPQVKKYIKWGIIAAVCLAIAIGVYMWWKSRSRGGPKDIGASEVDAAFDNSAPPTDVSLDQGFDQGANQSQDFSQDFSQGANQSANQDFSQNFGQDVPGTSDLMNDLPSTGRKSKR